MTSRTATSDRPGAGAVASHPAGSWTQLCEQVAELVQVSPAAPFAFDLVVVPSAGHRRALSQYLADRPGGPQLSAGFDFVSWAGLLNRLTGADAALGDPWRGTRAALAVWDAIDANRDLAELALLAGHIGAPGERPGRPRAVSVRIARLFGRYADAAPGMVAGWLAGRDLDANGEPLAARDLWQPVLWRALSTQIGPDPSTRQAELCARLAAGPVHALPERVLVVTLADPSAADLAILDALAQHHEVHLFQLAGTLRRPGLAGSAFGRRYGRRPALDVPAAGAASGSLLARIQHEISHDLAPRVGHPDDSLQVHICHGPDRQVAVLRDVLTGLFTDDPELQPRDVVVLCTDLARYAPLISANFGLSPQADSDFHPGHRLRVQLSSAVLGHSNAVLQLLERLFELHAGRATSVDLVDLCALAPVAQRFGFDAAALEQLGRLVAGAEVRWGVDLAQRQRNGVPLGQSTWFVGVERMLLSLALEPDPPVTLGALTPLPQVAGGDAWLVGALAELISRVRKVLGEFGQGATPAAWADRLRAALELLADPGPDEAWQLTQVLGILSTFAEQAAGRTAPWFAADVAGWLADRSRALTGRPNYGNGSLLVTELGDLRAVEHKVICVLGLDDELFPGAAHADGDDLLARADAELRPHWTLDRRARRRQDLLDALLAAGERFIVVCQGADESSGRIRPQPIAVADLLAAANLGAAGRWRATPRESVVHWHPMHPHGEHDFGSGESAPLSFDTAALQGAQALQAPARPTEARHRLVHLPPAPSAELDLVELVRFFTNPARGLLQASAGVSLSRFDSELATELPIEPGHLAEWAIGDSLLDSLLSGHDPGQAAQAEQLSGKLVPLPRNLRMLNGKLDNAQQIAQAAEAARAGVAELVDCSVELEGVRLQGRLTLHGGQLVSHRFGGLKARDALSSWIQLLALAASEQTEPGLAAIMVGARPHRLLAPDPVTARNRLAGLVTLRDYGLSQVLPLPLEAAAGFVDLFCFERGEPLDRARAEFAKVDANWRYFFTDFDDLLTVPRPSAQGAEPWFGSLATWTLRPIVDAMSRWWPGREVDQ